MVDTRLTELKRLSEETFKRFDGYRSLCQDIAENFYPMRADFTTELALSDYASDLMEDSPLNARETLGNAMDAMLRQGDWFKMGTGDRDRDAKPANSVGLNRGTSAMLAILRNPYSGWSDASKEWDMDWVSFGSVCGSVEESETRDYLMFRAWHPRDCAWILGENRRVDTFYRNLDMSARDIKRRVDSGRWAASLPQSVLNAAQNEPQKTFKLRHILMRSDDLYGSSRKDMARIRHPFVSCYIDLENDVYLHDAGAPVFNYFVGRHRTLSGKPWGFSPMALNSIASARMIQEMSLVILEQGQKAVDPPTIGAGQVFVRDINMFAGGHTEVDLEQGQKLRDVFATVETGRVEIGMELRQDTRNLIAEAWLLNKLTLPNARDMREIEVMVRTDEFRRAALPFFQPVETNYHDQVLGITYQMAANMRVIRGEMFSPELRAEGVGFIYSSPLSEADGQKVVAQYQTMIGVIAAGAQIDKTVASIIDLRGATTEAVARGTKPEWVLPEDKQKAATEEADVASQLSKAAEIAREGAGATADVANAAMAAQQAGLAPAPGA